MHLALNLEFLNMQHTCKPQREHHLFHRSVTFSFTGSRTEHIFNQNPLAVKSDEVCSADSFNINILFNFPAHFFLPFHNVKRSVCGRDHPAPVFGSHYLITAAGEARNRVLAFPLLPVSG